MKLLIAILLAVIGAAALLGAALVEGIVGGFRTMKFLIMFLLALALIAAAALLGDFSTMTGY